MPIDQSHKSHNALDLYHTMSPFHNRNVHTHVHFWYKMVHYEIQDLHCRICATGLQICEQWSISKSNLFLHKPTDIFKSTISMGWCKKNVTSLLTHWSCVFLALTHRYVNPENQYRRYVTLVLTHWYHQHANFSCQERLLYAHPSLFQYKPVTARDLYTESVSATGASEDHTILGRSSYTIHPH